MSIITTNTSSLNPMEKCSRGATIVAMSTDNPLAPGNAAQLAKFVLAQNALVATTAAVNEARDTLKQLIAARNNADAVWDTEVNALAGVTQAVTGGDKTAILSTGFGVRSSATPTQPVAQIENVKVRFNGVEGYSDIKWKPDENADSYVLECSPDPIGPNTFKYVVTVADAFYSGNGATPGQRCWYRIAGVNRLGQGPWSEPALRPVM